MSEFGRTVLIIIQNTNNLLMLFLAGCSQGVSTISLETEIQTNVLIVQSLSLLTRFENKIRQKRESMMATVENKCEDEESANYIIHNEMLQTAGCIQRMLNSLSKPAKYGI